MVLSAQSIRARCTAPVHVLDRGPMLDPFHERTKLHGVSFGLSSAGYDVRIAEAFILKPGDFELASTIEKFNMPDDLIGIVHDKSSFARRGVCVQNTVIEPGWSGYLTLEITNHGCDKISIAPGTGIAQILFHVLDRATDQPYADGKYQFQKAGPQPAIFER